MSRVRLMHAEKRAEIASRVSEIVRMLYFSQIRGKRLSRKAASDLGPSLEPMLSRLGLVASDFSSQSIAALAQHRKAICVPRPRCKQCPLVSFCKTGAARVQRDKSPIVVDLFGGVGGMGTGFRQAGFRIGLAVEYDRNAAQTYRYNNPGVVVKEMDVTDLNAADVRKIIGTRPAAICAGPPCQSYSLAGKRESRDPRHHLFRHVLAIARGLKPDVVVIENVVGIESDVGSRNFLQIIRAELGRLFTPEVYLLRALDYGVPQARRRYFFIGRQRKVGEVGKPRASHRELGVKGRLPQTPTVTELFKALPRRQHGQAQDWVKMKDGRIIWNVGTMEHAPRVVKKISKIMGGEARLSYRRVPKTYANTVVAGHRALPVHPTLHRTMSVREAAVIQGFDNEFVFMGARSTQPLQVANAVPPPLARAIARRIKRVLKK